MAIRPHSETRTSLAHGQSGDVPTKSSITTKTVELGALVAGYIDKAVQTRDNDELRSLVETALAGLGPRDREILTRFYLRGQTQEQICTDLGLTETQFRLLKSRVKARFPALGRKTLTRKHSLPNTTQFQGAPSEGTLVGVDRIVPIVAHAVAVFGDEQRASHWLANPQPLLDNRSPFQVLFQDGDFDAVDQILTRIEHNIPS